jgi:hypothetical protein
MISISITAEAYEAIKATLPEAAGSWPTQTDERGLIRLCLDRPFVDRLGQTRGPGESYSYVIMPDRRGGGRTGHAVWRAGGQGRYNHES